MMIIQNSYIGYKFLYPNILLILLLSIIQITSVYAAPYPSAAIVRDMGSNNILYARNIHTPIYPASLTKMMTLYLTFKALQQGRLTLDGYLNVSSNAERQPASKLNLRLGKVITVEQAIQALIVKSANDVAVVLAENLAQTEQQFARQMTATALLLGMSNTVFQNASGLPHPAQISTAYDMSILTHSIIRDFSEYYSYFSTKKFTYNNKTYHTYNQLLLHYQGMDGLKTGFIRTSGYHLAASAIRREKRIIAIIIGESKQTIRNQKMAKLLDYGFLQLQNSSPLQLLLNSPRFQHSVEQHLRRSSLINTRHILQNIIEYQLIQLSIPPKMITDYRNKYLSRNRHPENRKQ